MRDEKHIDVEFEQIIPVIEEKLKSGGSFSFSPRGVSMLPLIRQGIDSVVISPVNGRLKKYDVPFYRRDDGHFVLHRIVGFKDGNYVLCGDNQTLREYGIRHEQVIGVMTEIHTPDKIINVKDKEYLKYVKKRVCRQWLRGKAGRLKRIVRRMAGNRK